MSGNEIEIKITAENDTVPVVKGVKDGLRDVETSADKAGVKLESLGKRTASVKADLKKFEEGIATSKKALSELTTALAHTDDAAQRLDIKKAISKVQSDLGSMNRGKKLKLSELMDLGEGAAADAAQSWIKSLNSSLTKIAPEGMASAGIAIGVAMAPEIGGLLAAAVVGGAGLTGIVGGVLLAARDPRIKAAGKDLGQSLLGDLTQRGKVFVEPVLASIKQVKAGYAALAPDLSRGFQALAANVQPLVGSLLKAAGYLVKGWADASAAAGPVLKSLGGLVEHIGSDLGDMFTTFAGDAPQAASAVDDLTGSLDSMIKTVTIVGDGLAKTKGWLDNFDDSIDHGRYALEDWLTKMNGAAKLNDLTADGYEAGSEAANLYRQKIIGAAGSLNDYAHYTAKAQAQTAALAQEQTAAAKAAEGQQAALKDVSNELKAQSDPMFALINAQKDLRTAQKEYDVAVKKNGQNSDGATAALEKLTTAALSMETASGQLGTAMGGKLTPAMRATLGAAGLTKNQIDALETSFREARNAGNDFAKKYGAALSVRGGDVAMATIEQAREAALNYQSTYTATLRVRTLAAGIDSAGRRASGGISGAAANGSTSSGRTWVGENGPELMDLSPGTRVWSHGDSQRMAKSGGSGGGTLTLRLAASGNAVLDDLFTFFFQRLQVENRTQFGGNVNLMFGATR